MPPAPTTGTTLAPLDSRKTRALTTIYAPRKLKPRKHKTAQTRMLDELPIKPTLSPFHPLPAIGQKLEDKPKTKVIVLDLNKNERPSTIEKSKFQEVLKPLTPLRIHGYIRKSLIESPERKPQQLLREQTYDVLDPIYVNAAKIKKHESPMTSKSLESMSTADDSKQKEPRISPKTRFRKAAITVAKLQTSPETGKLLCLRERETTFTFKRDEDNVCRLQRLPQTPTQKLNKLSEIFQSLDMKGRHRDKMKKENSWF